ncbi:hypothetical protein E2562_037866 [Oryza meyeriana var. granulata]|uniref:Uncharacterized protein n=1 Tax=Oryza meyeriana var. granulata TaxID=110450 RepID=A0A6G1ETY2_9ORYZ|nr:hypothetical protein E2562_037866 [Oryza meyeriana var. granulata]
MEFPSFDRAVSVVTFEEPAFAMGGTLLHLQMVPQNVNKPTLPLAYGEYSPATGVALVSAFAIMSVRMIQSMFYVF